MTGDLELEPKSRFVARNGSKLDSVLENHNRSLTRDKGLKRKTNKVKGVIRHVNNNVKTTFTGPAYSTVITLNSIDIEAFIDTGSVISLVTHNFVRDNFGEHIIKPISELGGSSNSVNFVTANGDSLNYLGYISSTVVFPSLKTQFDSIFLVIPTVNKDHVLIGTNILQFLEPLDFSVKDSLYKACIITHRLVNQFNPARSVNRITKIEKNSINFEKGILRVKPANFNRTVLLTPSDKSVELGLIFPDICVDIPSHQSKVDIPFKVCNVSNVSHTIPRNFPIYSVSSVNKFLIDSVDPRDETLPDKEFLELFKINYDNFNKEQISDMHKLILKHKSLFALNSSQLGCLKDAEYKIELLDNKPVKHRYRPIHPSIYDKVQDQLKVLLQTGVITESNSPWNSPLTVVVKPNKELRLCVDYRKLNNQCKKDAKPLPRVSETLSHLKGNKYFSSVDMISGYYQLKLAEESKDLTAFSAGSGKLYRFERVPFGHTGSGGFFQRCIENVLSELLYKHCVVYLDDCLILGKDFSDHCNSLELVFNRLAEAGLKLKPQKCNLFALETKFLGHVVSASGIKTDSDKTDIIKDWKIPSNTKEVRQFIGLLSYYRSFIKNFSNLASPLTDLLKGKLIKRGKSKMFVAVKFYWGIEQQKAFELLKLAFLDNVCLQHPDFTKKFILEVDASRGGLGAVLSQEYQGKVKPIAFASRKTSLSESSYPSHKLEFLALKWAVTQKFKDYLQHTYFDIYTDNNPLAYIIDKLDIDAVSQRWCAELSKYHFKVHYRTGKSNVVADALSRQSNAPKCNDEVLHKWCKDVLFDHDSSIQPQMVNVILSTVSEVSPIVEQSYLSSMYNNVDVSDHSDSVMDKTSIIIENTDKIDWKHIQENDDDIKIVIDRIVGNCNILYKDVENCSKVVRFYYRKRDKLFMKDGLLFKRCELDNSTVSSQLILNSSCMPILFKYYHDDQAHLGEKRTILIFQERFFWPGMVTQIKDYISKCKVCLCRKTLPSLNKTVMHHRPKAKYPMDILSLDHLVIDSSVGKIKVLTIIDEFSKFLYIIPVRNEKSSTTADAINKNIFLKYGLPNVIHTDNAPSFCNKVVAKLLRDRSIIHTKSTPYHSMGNSIVERIQSVILNMLGTLTKTEKTRWYNHCDYIAYAYNTTIHSTTGFTPYFLLFGRIPKLIGDAALNINFTRSGNSVGSHISNLRKAYLLCRDNINSQNVKSKIIYDENLSRNIKNLQIGDIVFVRNQHMRNKIDNRWLDDPFIVVDRPDSQIPVYKVKCIESKVFKLKHRNQLLPLYRSHEDEEIVEQPKKKKLVKKRSVRKMSSSSLCTTQVDVNSYSSDDDEGLTLNKELDDGSNTEVVVRLNSDSIDSDSNNDSEDNVGYRTRYGRIIKPPDRYTPINYISGDVGVWV